MMLTATDLTQIAAILLSLASSYIPGWSDKYQAFDGVTKRLIMLLLLAGTTGTIFALACSNLVNVPCDRAGALGLLKALGLSVVANQTTFLLSPKPNRFVGATQSAASGRHSQGRPKASS